MTADAERRRVAWRCRRGSKELDLILSAFVEKNYADLNADEQKLFERLLDSADPQLTDWFYNGVVPDDAGMANLVRRILSAAGA